MVGYFLGSFGFPAWMCYFHRGLNHLRALPTLSNFEKKSDYLHLIHLISLSAMTQPSDTEHLGNFPGIPPFPDDVATAPLLRLSLGKLLAGDLTEYERLFEASVDIGFFYLDLQDSEHGESLLDDADDLFRIGESLFELPLEEKVLYDFSKQNSYFGYKGQGVSVVDKDGNLDRNEFYNVCHVLQSCWLPQAFKQSQLT